MRTGSRVVASRGAAHADRRRIWRRCVMHLAAQALLLVSAGCHQRVPGVLPVDIADHPIDAVELMNGTVVKFDEPAHRVAADSVVGRVSGTRRAIAVAAIRRADVTTLDGRRTTLLTLGVIVALGAAVGGAVIGQARP